MKVADGLKGPGGSDKVLAASSTDFAETRAKLADKYNIIVVGESWSNELASSLLKQVTKLCGKGLDEQKSDLACDLSQKGQWTLTSSAIPDDVLVDRDKITVSDAAFQFARPRSARVNGTVGKVYSRRLLHAVMRALTDHGHKPAAVDALLRRLFNATIQVDIGYTKLTDVTTYEDRGRFMAFRPRELMFMLEAWSQTPKHLYVAPGLRYVTRRQQGLNHPYYGSTTGVSWPANRDVSYQEYMDFSFNSDAYTSRHLFLHEKTHFFWARSWSEQLRQEWGALGSWTQPQTGGDPANTGDTGWFTASSTAFISDYGAGNNPNEDMAEDMAAYVLHPRLLRARAPTKFDFIRQRIMGGVHYLEHAPYAADLPESAGTFL
eukprot:CAMPEP_0113730088 /NCGR_PEP_ID=MMETSP0038_2-20120614/42961_1 /TAXON_ID=2898 /ORGANISM="Cryptomonas paramecium" /LENGTH=376 /DNA_ID=CAMNT_0000662103 /DNA_START=374 /DNA_END=1501 /DNA_ORIENTATION=+ /assembly_acc=CAM_ASM_000170